MKILIIGLDIAPAVDLFGDERLENFRRLMAYGCYGRLSGFGAVSKLKAWTSLLTGQPSNAPELIGISDLNPQTWPEIVQGMAIWKEVERQGKQVIVDIVRPSLDYDGTPKIEAIHTASLEQFETVRRQLLFDEWDYFQFIDNGLEQLENLVAAGELDQAVLNDYRVYLDQQLGSIFELLTDETLILVVSPASTPSRANGDGSFILAASNNPLSGEIDGVLLEELAPTVLELAGYEISASMKSPSLAAGRAMDLLASGDLSADEEAILRERLSGLGYIS